MDINMLTLLNEESYAHTLVGTGQGMLIGFKKLCPHCKNMEKVLEKCADRLPELTLLGLDAEENPEDCAQLGLERAPTILILRRGTVVGRMAGLMNPKELCAFYQQSMRTA